MVVVILIPNLTLDLGVVLLGLNFFPDHELKNKKNPALFFFVVVCVFRCWPFLALRNCMLQVGVLTRGIIDDGRGKARSFVFHHKHEKDSGR